MGTVEIMIVFSALMALIALVTIGIDWIGKPLKHRRFIERIYRFEDEKLPTDEYGNTNFDIDPAFDVDSGALHAAPQPMHAPAPTFLAPHPMAQPPLSGHEPAQLDQANPTVAIAVASQPAPRQVATIDSDLAASATASRSAFTDSLSEAEPAGDTAGDGTLASLPEHGLIAGTAAAAAATAFTASSASASVREWEPTMSLDTTIDDQKPSLAVKAERFWMATALAAVDSHFDADDIDRMASGKAPRRSNPRSGRAEAMQLTGLRQASERQDVRMRWPDESVDPWSAT